jgi:hypothetical protein
VAAPPGHPAGTPAPGHRRGGSTLATAGRTRPTGAAELQAWQQQRRLAGDAAGAYQLWREHLPPTLQPYLASVFDGGFEAEPGNTPYHWQWPRQAGVAIVRDDSHAQDGQHALRVEFAGRSLRFDGPRQTLGPLPAGTYRLQASADNRTGNPRPFHWQLHCGRQLLASLALADSPGWQNRQQGFVLATPAMNRCCAWAMPAAPCQSACCAAACGWMRCRSPAKTLDPYSKLLAKPAVFG